MKQIETTGFVNFPIDKYEDTDEGGVFVRLVVVPTENDFVVCCGGMNNFVYDESYLGSDKDDVIKEPEDIDDMDTADLATFIKKWDAENIRKTEKFFPDFYKDVDGFDIRQFMSIPLLAVMTIGSTNWSSGEWICAYNDLTKEGKELYNKIKSLYEGVGEIYLQTWLDT